MNVSFKYNGWWISIWSTSKWGKNRSTDLIFPIEFQYKLTVGVGLNGEMSSNPCAKKISTEPSKKMLPELIPVPS
jgi:hypothetical protein